MKNDPGQLNRKIVIERATNTPDDYGDSGLSWSTQATVWAKIEDAPSREVHEYLEAKQIESRRVTLFTVRNTSEVSDVTGKDRISYDGGTYDILTTRTVESERFIELLTERKLTQ